MRFRLLALFAVVAVAGCGGASAPTGSATGTAYIRFLNGSPDQTGVDFDLPAGTRYIPDLQFKALTAYQTIAAGTYSVGATAPGSTTALVNSTTGYPASTNSFVVEANTRNTVVLGGSQYNGDLQICTFDEPLFATASTQAEVQFNNCAPTYSGTIGTIAIGYYLTSNSTPVALLSTGLSDGANSGKLALPATAANGVGFYASSPAIGSLLPSQLDANDTTNALPFVNDQNVSVFILDGPIGTSNLTLVGAIDPNN